MATEYLVNASNRVTHLLSQPGATVTEYTDAATIVCQTLWQTVDNAEFRRALWYLQEVRHAPHISGEIDAFLYQIAEDVHGFMQEFFRVHTEFLESSGFAPAVAASLTAYGLMRVEEVKRWTGDPNMLFDDLYFVRQYSCDVSQSLERFLVPGQEREAALRAGPRWAPALLYGTGGAAIMATSADALVRERESPTPLRERESPTPLRERESPAPWPNRATELLVSAAMGAVLVVDAARAARRDVGG